MTTDPEDTCRVYAVDGKPVAVHGGQPLDAPGKAALEELVRAVGAHVAKTDPHLGVRQELAMACLAAMRCIPDGRIQLDGHCTISDGAQVKARLKAAVKAARDALTPDRPT